jgi:hypothetical protein
MMAFSFIFECFVLLVFKVFWTFCTKDVENGKNEHKYIKILPLLS